MNKKYIQNMAVGLGIFIIVLACLSGSALWYLEKYAAAPMNVSGGISEPLSPFLIKPGQGLKIISYSLEKERFIKNRHMFLILAVLRGQDKSIKAGEYDISPCFSPEKILKIFVSGQIKLYRLTIPEGLNIREIAQLVETAGFGSKKNFMALASDPEFISSFGIKADSLEGYLFPETYFFPRGTGHKKIIKTMVQGFNSVFIPRWHETARKMGFSLHEIVILASIIEKETGVPEERPLIASVFHNRLKKGMRLESDPTVIYGIPDFNGNITRKDLRTPHSYNTYILTGLPGGPIACPGKMSLEAAVFPARTNYLFFVSKQDTTHYFSKNYQEHKRAVMKYQLNQ